MVGSSQIPYTGGYPALSGIHLAPMLGQDPNVNTLPMANPWVHNQNLGMVFHGPGKCPQCDATMQHIMDDMSYSSAVEACNQHFHHAASNNNVISEETVSLHRQIGELMAQLATEQSDYSQICRKLDEAKDDLDCAREERDELSVKYDDAQADITQLQGENL